MCATEVDEQEAFCDLACENQPCECMQIIYFKPGTCQIKAGERLLF